MTFFSVLTQYEKNSCLLEINGYKETDNNSSLALAFWFQSETLQCGLTSTRPPAHTIIKTHHEKVVLYYVCICLGITLSTI